MPKVSVIVPIYGVEQYIERCARSLFEQTLDDIEYIFVNDCTKDNSVTVLQKVMQDYTQRQSQIKIVHHEVNKGLPVARQTGLKEATGDYIIHCDSDDWVTTDAYEKMYAKAIEDDADIVICDFYVSDGTNTRAYYKSLVSDPHIVIFSYINIWTHLVRRDLYAKNITYPKGNMFEDKVVTIQLSCYANNISLISEPLYYYYENATSICRVFTEEKCLNRFRQAVDNVNIIADFVESKGLSKEYATELLRLKYEARHQIAPITNQKKYYKEWKRCYPEITTKMLFATGITLSEKIRFFVTYFGLFSLFRSAK